MKRFVMMAGGTGGHVIPALAVAKALQNQGQQVTWIGTEHGIEHQLVPNAQITIDYIDIAGFRRTGFRRQLAMPFMLIKALWQSVSILRRRKADVVIGFGGFAAGPGGIAAAILRKPLVLHEQNSIAGMTNKYLSKVAKKVMTGFAKVEGLNEYEWLGNPVRPEIAQIGANKHNASLNAGLNTGQDETPHETETKTNILIVGGSQGAKALNKYLPTLLMKLNQQQINIWHQTGQRDLQQVKVDYADYDNVKVSAFIDDMASAYHWADVVICRAGAMTVAEICAAGMLAIFVPYAYAVSDHQRKNAQYLVNNNAAFMLDENDLKKEDCLAVLESIMNDPSQRQKMSQAALALAKPDATNQVANRCLEVANA